MAVRPEMSISEGYTVWVWDSIWLPAVVVRRADRVRVSQV